MENMCPFGSTLVTEICQCRHAEQVVRRGGAEIICQDDAAYARCINLFQQLKQVALPEFEVEDDLTTMPHSVLQKIQFGGLLGLQQLLGGEAAETVPDVARLVDTAATKYHDLENIPYAELAEAITTYKLKRRKNRR